MNKLAITLGVSLLAMATSAPAQGLFGVDSLAAPATESQSVETPPVDRIADTRAEAVAWYREVLIPTLPEPLARAEDLDVPQLMAFLRVVFNHHQDRAKIAETRSGFLAFQLATLPGEGYAAMPLQAMGRTLENSVRCRRVRRTSRTRCGCQLSADGTPAPPPFPLSRSCYIRAPRGGEARVLAELQSLVQAVMDRAAELEQSVAQAAVQAAVQAD